MRVIAGRFKGRRLKPVKSANVRSTADRVRESLFNILAAEVPDAVALDLFCGAGCLGIEALSRGAEHVTFVDRSRQSVECTRQNLETVDAVQDSAVHSGQALTVLRSLAAQGERFSLIFADPPYEEGWSVKLLNAIAASDALAPEGILVIEHHKKEPPGPSPAGFSVWTERRFGDTMFTIWRWNRTVSDDVASAVRERGEE